MSSAFRKKTYGMVRPVKAKKPTVPVKPNILTMKSLRRKLATTPAPLHIDVLSAMLAWFQDSITYVKYIRDKKSVKMNSKLAVKLVAAFTWTKKGHASNSNEEKERCFLSASTSPV